MLFSIIRLALGGLVFLIICGLIRKKKIMYSRRWTVIAFVSAILLTTIAALIPIENLFITFSSPDSAYHYNHLGKVRLIVPGQQTDFVVGNDGESDIYVIVPKKSDRWQIGMGTDLKCAFQTTSEGIDLYVYQYKKSDDYYVIVFDANGGASNIMDNRDSTFQYSETTIEALDETFYTYYAYVHGFNQQYSITVNGRTIAMDD